VKIRFWAIIVGIQTVVLMITGQAVAIFHHAIMKCLAAIFASNGFRIPTVAADPPLLPIGILDPAHLVPVIPLFALVALLCHHPPVAGLAIDLSPVNVAILHVVWVYGLLARDTLG